MFDVSGKLTVLTRSEPHQYQNTLRHIHSVYSTELLVF